MLTVKQAFDIAMRNTPVLESQRIPLTAALGKTLAENAISDMDIPPQDNSAMDGFGVRANDIQSASSSTPVRLRIIGNLYAGQTPRLMVRPNEAIRIMTGAPIPQGVDAVVKVEDTKEKNGWVYITGPLDKGDNIRKRGENIRKGEKVISRGKVLHPAEIGMLAAVGYAQVKVIKTPQVAVLATGDELVDVNQPSSRLIGSKIRNSNSYAIIAAVMECNGQPVNIGIAKDTPQKLEALIRKGLRYDVLVISGGVSMGTTDYVRPVLRKLGAQMKFWKVAQRPGQPFAFGVLNGKPIFCLPGNPVSVMTTFETYVRPALMKMTGRNDFDRPHVIAKIGERIEVRPGHRYFMRVILKERKGKYYARLTGSQGSGILKSMVLANGLLVIPENVSIIRKGTEWPIILLSGQPLRLPND